MLIAFHSPVTRRTIQIDAAVARTPQDRQHGFAFRPSINRNEAIFFAFPSNVTTPFTMENTRFPLDIIFLDSSGKIVHLARQATPMSVTPYPSPYPYRYVIEVPGGWTAQYGIDTNTGVGWAHNAFLPPV